MLWGGLLAWLGVWHVHSCSVGAARRALCHKRGTPEDLELGFLRVLEGRALGYGHSKCCQAKHTGQAGEDVQQPAQGWRSRSAPLALEPAVHGTPGFCD